MDTKFTLKPIANITRRRPASGKTSRLAALFPLQYLKKRRYSKLLICLNYCIAIPALVFTFPVMAAIAVAIKIDSPGPAIFRQKRVGKNRRATADRRISDKNQTVQCDRRQVQKRREDLGGRPFTFYKFRTMKTNAKELYPELYEYKYSEPELKSLKFKNNEDPRVTRVGKWLRKTTLDELPNFINVLTGDMNLVGPRPEIPEMAKYYKGEQKRKFSVKPGVTGLAQISGRGDLKFNETIQYDIEYLSQRSFLKDLSILVKTLEALIFRRGAY